jgi:hypothetical protein
MVKKQKHQLPDYHEKIFGLLSQQRNISVSKSVIKQLKKPQAIMTLERLLDTQREFIGDVPKRVFDKNFNSYRRYRKDLARYLDLEFMYVDPESEMDLQDLKSGSFYEACLQYLRKYK